MIVTDTVGFIRDLPKELVGAFRTTLEELREADLLVHVVDATGRIPESFQAAAHLEHAPRARLPPRHHYGRIPLRRLDLNLLRVFAAVYRAPLPDCATNATTWSCPKERTALGGSVSL